MYKALLMVFGILAALHGCSSDSSSGGGTGSDGGLSPDPAASNDNWSIPSDQVLDGGPGKDGIPSIDNPRFIAAADADLFPDALVIGVKRGGQIRAYPHNILNWHEIVNDRFDGTAFAVNFCPLTGSSLLWEAPEDFADKTFGVSGLLYNSNLILYDRETDSNWSQMLMESVNGELQGAAPEHHAVVETTWETWSQMYPATTVLSKDTGFSRDYSTNPYGSYPTNNTLLFPAANAGDDRLHVKERVLGLVQGEARKVYVVDQFAPDLQLLNETLDGTPFVVVGSAGFNFAAAYERSLDGTVLDFMPVKGDLPVIMMDNEGNQWDVFGVAVSGPRSGQALEPARAFIAYWFAWTAFYPGSTIHSFD